MPKTITSWILKTDFEIMRVEKGITEKGCLATSIFDDIKVALNKVADHWPINFSMCHD